MAGDTKKEKKKGVKDNTSKGGLYAFVGLLVVGAIVVVVLILLNILDVRPKLDWGTTPSSTRVAFGSTYTSPQITVLKEDKEGEEAKNVTIAIDFGPDWITLTEDNKLTGTAPEFKGEFDDVVQNVTITANYTNQAKEEKEITHSFAITTGLPEAKDITWDADTKSAGTIIDGNRVYKEASNNTIDWVYSTEPLPSTLKAAILTFTINDSGYEGRTDPGGNSYSNVMGLDLIASPTPTFDLSNPSPSTANLLQDENTTRFGVDFRQGIFDSKTALNATYRALGTASGTAGTYISIPSEENDGQGIEGDLFNGSVVKFYISGTKVVEIKVRDQSLSNFDEYNLADLSSNDWYITVRDPVVNYGKFDVSGTIALLE